MKTCEACGKEVQGGVVMGPVLICRQCEPDIRAKVDELRADGLAVHVGHIARAYFRKNHNGGDYLLRDIPKEMWQEIKHRAVDEGCSLRDIVLAALYSYIKK